MSEAENRLRKVMAEFDCTTGTLHREEGGFLELVASVGIPDVLFEKINHIPVGKGIAGMAAKSKGPVELCNLQENLGGVAKEDARKTGVAGSLAIPIIDGARVVGTIGIGMPDPHDFSDEEKDRLARRGEDFLDLMNG